METNLSNAEAAQIASEVAARIANLETLFEDSLKDEMSALKEALILNPNAAALLKDEDVGLLVKNLKRTVSVAVNEAAQEKTRTPKAKKQMSKEELEKALAAEGF